MFCDLLQDIIVDNHTAGIISQEKDQLSNLYSSLCSIRLCHSKLGQCLYSNSSLSAETEG